MMIEQPFPQFWSFLGPGMKIIHETFLRKRKSKDALFNAMSGNCPSIDTY